MTMAVVLEWKAVQIERPLAVVAAPTAIYPGLVPCQEAREAARARVPAAVDGAQRANRTIVLRARCLALVKSIWMQRGCSEEDGSEPAARATLAWARQAPGEV